MLLGHLSMGSDALYAALSCQTGQRADSCCFRRAECGQQVRGQHHGGALPAAVCGHRESAVGAHRHCRVRTCSSCCAVCMCCTKQVPSFVCTPPKEMNPVASLLSGAASRVAEMLTCVMPMLLTAPPGTTSWGAPPAMALRCWRSGQSWRERGNPDVAAQPPACSISNTCMPGSSSSVQQQKHDGRGRCKRHTGYKSQCWRYPWVSKCCNVTALPCTELAPLASAPAGFPSTALLGTCGWCQAMGEQMSCSSVCHLLSG